MVSDQLVKGQNLACLGTFFHTSSNGDVWVHVSWEYPFIYASCYTFLIHTCMSGFQLDVLVSLMWFQVMKKTHYYLVDKSGVTPGAAVSTLQFNIIQEDPFAVCDLEVRSRDTFLSNSEIPRSSNLLLG